MQKFQKVSGAQKGFTLLEIMVVIVILGLLVAVVAPNVLQNQDRAMVEKPGQILRYLSSRWICTSLITIYIQAQTKGWQHW